MWKRTRLSAHDSRYGVIYPALFDSLFQVLGTHFGIPYIYDMYNVRGFSIVIYYFKPSHDVATPV